MKIVQINTVCDRGSTGKIVVSISKVLNRCSIPNYIFYGDTYKSDYADGIRIVGMFKIRIHQILSRVFGDQGFHSYFSTMKMIRKIKKLSPDAILLHNLHGYYLHLGVLFKFLKRYGCPVYWTFHDCWPFTGHCTHFTIEKCDKWRSVCFDCKQKHKYPYSWFFDRSNYLHKKKKELFTSLDDLTIITPSEWLAGLVKKSFFAEYPVRVINNGINLDVFKPTFGDFKGRYGISDKKVILGVSSTWSYYKGLDVFCDLYSILDKRKYKIVLVGTDASIDEKLPDGIISIHRTHDQRELAQIYTAADVFVNPTREENYPTVNMEAIACGTPVVTFDTGGCAEIVNEECGAVVHVDDIDELVKKIRYISENECFDDDSFSSRTKQFNEEDRFKEYVDLICS